MTRTIRIGTRGSALALAQAHWLEGAIEKVVPGSKAELVIIKTAGDRFVDRSLRAIGGKGLFVKEIEEALLAGTIDCAIHSMKDVPAEIPPGLTIAAIPQREDPRDVLIGRSDGGLAALAQGATVGTCSLRRIALLRAVRPDLKIHELRGNVDTRLRKLAEGSIDAIVLAAAGLRRLGLSPDHVAPFDMNTFLPAIGQGALAIETREDETAELVARLDHASTRIAVTAERAFLATAGGSCHTPLAAFGTVGETEISVDALIASPDGTEVLRSRASGKHAEAADIGARLAGELLARGGDRIIASLVAEGNNP